MPVEIVRIPYGSYQGLHEKIHPIALPKVFSSSGSKNVWMDRYARVQKILGYTKTNSSAMTTDTGASAVAVVGLAQYRSIAAGSTTRHMISVVDDGINEWEIFTSADNGATWTFRSDLGSTAVGNIPDFCQYGTKMYITTGIGTPKSWNGTAIAAAGATQSPTPACAAGAAGNLSGTYEYKLVSVVASGARSPGSVSSTEVQLDSEKGSVTWTAATGSEVGYELYRTTGTGRMFRFVAYIDGKATAAYTDNLSDIDITANPFLEEHGEAPPAAYFVEPHRQRLWYGNTDTYPLYVWYSDTNRPESFWLDHQYLSFEDSKSIGDEITGMVGNFQGSLVVFLERSVWNVSGTGVLTGGINDWQVRRSNAYSGAVSRRSIAQVPAGARYSDQTGELSGTGAVSLVYWSPTGDIRMFDGENDTVISFPVDTLTHNFNYAQRKKIFTLHDSERQHITWFFPDGTDTYCSKGVTWNYRYGVWYEWSPVSFASAVPIETSTNDAVILAGEAQTANGGFVYTLWNGNTFNTAAIEAVYFTAPLYMVDQNGEASPQITSRMRDLDVLLASAAGTTVTASWYTGDVPNTATAEGSKDIDSSGEALYPSDDDQTAVLASDSSIVYAGQDSVQVRFPTKVEGGDYPKGQAFRIKFSDNSTNPAWSLEAFVPGRQPLPGVRAINR